MKERQKGFLSESEIDHDSEIFNYIQELHEYTWRFIRVHVPGANGSLRAFIDQAVEIAEGTPCLLPKEECRCHEQTRKR